MFAIVPAHNEEETVAAVIRPLVRSGVFEDVLVVDDGSADRTAQAAADAGAHVQRLERNRGKGGAMLAGYHSLPERDRVAFFDADLLGLQPEHVHRLAYASDRGYDMVAGMRDKGALGDLLQYTWVPCITGERILRRWVVEALPDTCWSGYSIETGMNDVVARNGGRTILVPMRGLRIRYKEDKVGLLEGWRRHLKMARQIRDTRVALRNTEGMSCEI